ncbi:MAG: hypothetical protein JNK58_00880 [Phycisphaerae bacterium]|nr:hypothetical protein [Phycisphaerae bacterium]
MIGIAAGAAEASYMATITADNHYALYVDGPGGVSMVGGNELGAGGSPGTYNWSMAESYTFDTTGYIYIAVWSDDAVAQGLLADVRDSDGLLLHTGVAPWQVMVTGVTKGDGSSRPDASEIAMYSLQADTNSEWMTPYVGPKNLSSTAPWGKIGGIDEEARWTWGNPYNVSDPLIGGSNHVEYQIFRLAVPGPSGVGLAAAGLLTVMGRRRRS